MIVHIGYPIRCRAVLDPQAGKPAAIDEVSVGTVRRDNEIPPPGIGSKFAYFPERKVSIDSLMNGFPVVLPGKVWE